MLKKHQFVSHNTTRTKATLFFWLKKMNHADMVQMNPDGVLGRNGHIFINENGQEATRYFAFENQFAMALVSFTLQAVPYS